MPKASLVRHRSSRGDRQADEFRRDGEGWQGRNLGAAGGDRALTEPERYRALRLARALYKRGGMYASMIDRIRDFTVGDGVVLEFEDPEVEDYVRAALDDDWWRQLGRRWRETPNEGEYLLTVETGRRNPGEASAIPTGAVKFGRLEIERIKDVHVSARDPDEVVAIAIDPGASGSVVVYPVAGQGAMPVPELVAVDGKAVATGRLVAISYWRTNQLGPRGAPHLLRLLGKTGLVDDVVDANARKGEYLNRFVLHGVYKAQGDEEKDEAFENELFEVLANAEGPEAFVSSEARGVTISAITPDLKVLDQRALYDLVVDYICGSASVPKHWFGGGEGTTRATAIEQGSPAHRMLIASQADLQETLDALVRYLVWLGKASGRIRAEADERVRVQMALIATRDSQRDAGVLQQVNAILAFAEQRGYISPVEAQRIARGVLNAQTFIEASLDDEAPPVKPTDRIGELLGALPESVREALRKELPLHRRRNGDGV